MSSDELQAFMQGVIVSNEGKIIISETNSDRRIVNIDYGDNGTAVVTYSDGTTINITKVKKDDDGKITRIYMSIGDDNKYIDCVYEGDYIRSVGDVAIEDVESLGITTNANLQDKTVIGSTQGDILVTCDDGYDGLGTVTITKATAILQDKNDILPKTTNQTITYDSDYDGLNEVTILGDSNLVPENIVKGVTIFDVLGTAEGGGSGGEDMEVETLWEGMQTSEGDITLSESIDNYDAIQIRAAFCEGSTKTQRTSMLIFKDDYYRRDIYDGWNYCITQLGSRRITFDLTDSTTISIGRIENTFYVVEVVGIKFHESKHTYSTEEQVVGTWIDGKPIYEKTTEIDYGVDTTSSFTLTGFDASYYDSIISGNVFRCNTQYSNGFVPLTIWKTSDYTELRALALDPLRYIEGCKMYAVLQYTKTTD